MQALSRFSISLLLGLYLTMTPVMGSLNDGIPIENVTTVSEITVDNLKKDPLSLIFAFVDVDSASKIPHVCREWRRIANKMNLATHPYFITNDQLHAYFLEGPSEDFDLPQLANADNLGKLKERIVCYQLLLTKAKAAEESTGLLFWRLANTFAFLTQLNQGRDSQHINMDLSVSFEVRRTHLRSLPDGVDKAYQFRLLAALTQQVDEVREAYNLYRDFQSPDAAKLQQEFIDNTLPNGLFRIDCIIEDVINKNPSAPVMRALRSYQAGTIQGDYERALLNYADRSTAGPWWHQPGQGQVQLMQPVPINSVWAILSLVLDIVRIIGLSR